MKRRASAMNGRILLLLAWTACLLLACGDGEPEVSPVPEQVDPAVPADTVETPSPEDQSADMDTERTVGGRPMEDVRAGIAEIGDMLMEEYVLLLEEDPSASGTIEVSFRVTPGGEVVDREVTADMQLDPLLVTVDSALAALEFAPCAQQTDTIPVTVPITLLPPEATDGDMTE
jgi:hypothetical protein